MTLSCLLWSYGPQATLSSKKEGCRRTRKQRGIVASHRREGQSAWYVCVDEGKSSCHGMYCSECARLSPRLPSPRRRSGSTSQETATGRLQSTVLCVLRVSIDGTGLCEDETGLSCKAGKKKHRAKEG
ncbi:hypothetical protein EXIGLDRAFT_285517 [Exidia glandulosa HHB12029]|uniref:Uncharacterized protein n=1 Tax=Exidia glandulosa HHB12029 TaxID=1314781 RepID=A0A165M4D5_EXIGL|nr:hypothetical protein EXIGLDRAFT_285517 [Exidia glandulosa HHB12029]